MIEQFFSLNPFPDTNIPPIHLRGTVSRNNNILAVQFTMTGQTDGIFFPKVTPQPGRKDDLWQTTCFEFFLALPEKPEYWEFNMSPSGDWNAYHMDAYRQVGLREELAVQRLPFFVDTASDGVLLQAKIDLAPLFQADQPIQAQVTSVIEDKDGHETYWALLHPGPQADFHRREGFILQV